MEEAGKIEMEEVALKSKPMEKNYILTGLWLILIGSGWLLYNFRILNWAWMERYGLLVLGGFVLLRTAYLRKFKLTTALSLMAIGLFHIYLDQSDLNMRTVLPMYFIIIGAAFFVNFAIKPDRWWSLASSLILTTWGGLWLSRANDLLSYEWIRTIRTYWPLTFVLAGLILFTVAFIRQRKKKNFE